MVAVATQSLPAMMNVSSHATSSPFRQWSSSGMQARGNLRSLRKPADKRHSPERFPLAKIQECPRRRLNPVRLGGRLAVKLLSHRGMANKVTAQSVGRHYFFHFPRGIQKQLLEPLPLTRWQLTSFCGPAEKKIARPATDLASPATSTARKNSTMRSFTYQKRHSRIASPSPFGAPPGFRTGESCRTMPLIGEFSRGFPVSTARPGKEPARTCIKEPYYHSPGVIYKSQEKLWKTKMAESVIEPGSSNENPTFFATALPRLVTAQTSMQAIAGIVHGSASISSTILPDRSITSWMMWDIRASRDATSNHWEGEAITERVGARRVERSPKYGKLQSAGDQQTGRLPLPLGGVASKTDAFSSLGKSFSLHYPFSDFPLALTHCRTRPLIYDLRSSFEPRWCNRPLARKDVSHRGKSVKYCYMLSGLSRFSYLARSCEGKSAQEPPGNLRARGDLQRHAAAACRCDNPLATSTHLTFSRLNFCTYLKECCGPLPLHLSARLGMPGTFQIGHQADSFSRVREFGRLPDIKRQVCGDNEAKRKQTVK
ncbi:hypothetical protein PR048_017803 [Dryococelus australis]|uniref:Uncharacterized protein n=1 Tax=Dryococelus australis TaxID=614101 RepID=A0ABQ9HAG7_9NEOP|nr:hypothetical protein PR048_017803 [Dryococelus australis]